MKLEDALREMERVQRIMRRSPSRAGGACVRTNDGDVFGVQVTTYGEVWDILETPEAVERWIAEEAS